MKHKASQITPHRSRTQLRFRVYGKALRSRTGLTKLKLVGNIAKHELQLVGHWWHAKDVRYTWRWRAANLALALLILFGVLLPVIEQFSLGNRYHLSADALQLVGASDAKLQKQLKYTGSSYQFNQAAVQQTTAMRTQTGAASGQKDDTSTYALTIPQDFAKGTTYTDVNTDQSFQLVPQFNGNPVKEVQGHLVIPIDGAQAIYTLKGNGLKEDVVVPKATQDSLSFAYTLKLPKTLEAKVIPGSSGDIGIYSADPTLYGKISASDSKDQALLQKARENGDKTNLVFGLPSPTIKTVDGTTPGTATARFELHGNTLTVVANGLTSIRGAFTIDPSVVVTSASDFQSGGNNEGMIDFDSTNNQINRSGVTGGSMGSWTVNNYFGVSMSWFSQTIYNGYLYTAGGYNGTDPLYDCWYMALGSDGSLGTQQTCTSLTSARNTNGLVAYNGYLYTIGGNNAGTEMNTVEYAAINSSNGSLGSWKTATSLPNVRGFAGSFAYNGYLYTIGGSNSSNTAQTTSYYAPIRADGSLGSWSTTTALPAARTVAQVTQYNGYVYVLGGTTSYNLDGTFYSTSYYTRINSDGTFGNWSTTTALPANTAAGGIVAYNGYMYLIGGTSGNTTAGNTASVYYAQINADGMLGSWIATTSFANRRAAFSASVYNGYIYTVGGSYDSVGGSGVVVYGKINAAGTTTGFSSATSLSSSYAVTNACSVAANGYLYVLGGNNAGSAKTTVYKSAIANDGTLGTWATTTSLPAALYSEGCASANGYIYTVGGYTGTAGVTSVYYSAIGSSGTLGAWSSYTGTATGSLPASVYNVGVTIANNYLYVVGGAGSTTAAVNFAQINPSGGLVTTLNSCPASGTLSHKTWCTTSSLPSGRIDTNTVAVGGYLYEIAGYSGGATATVYYAALNSSNGTLGSWQTSSNTLPTAVYWPSIVATNGSIYVIGGYTGSATTTNVYYTTPTSSGDIGAWQSAPSLATGQYEATAAAYHGTIYDIGGYTTGPQYTVLAATVNSGGSGAAAQDWSWAGTTTNSTRLRGATVAYNGYLYAVGGDQTSVEYAPINADGSTGSWTVDSHALSAQRSYAGVIAYNGYMYVLGGSNNAGTFYKTIWYAPIAATGGLSANWASAGSNTTNGGAGVGLVAYNGYMYSIGGWDGSTDWNTVQYAAINSNGTIGSWSSAASFDTGRSDGAAVAYDGYVYLLGGNGAADYNTVQYAPINSDGTLGTWKYTSSFTTPRIDMTIGAYNGYLYLVGGSNSSFAEFGDTQYAAINPDGTLGTWQQALQPVAAGGGSYVPGRSRASSAQTIYNGVMYGVDGDMYGSSNTQYAMELPLNTIARVGHYSKVIALGVATNITSISYNGTVPGGNAAVTYQIAGANGIFGSTATTASVAGNGGCFGNAVGAYYVRIQVTLDDSSGMGSGGFYPDGTNNAKLTDFTVSYNPIHPQPNIRLRGGQTLQSGSLSPYDTCM